MSDKVVHGHWESFPWTPFPEYGGSKSIAYRSSDGMIAAGAAQESGKATLTWPCDEFFFVTQGWTKCEIAGGETFPASQGHIIYLPRGTTVNMEFGDDFKNVAIFISTDGNKVTLV